MIRLSLRRNKKQTIKLHDITGPHLTIVIKGNQYMVKVRNEFDTLQETFESHALNNEYEIFVSINI